MFKLRDYQEKAVKKSIDHFKSKSTKNGIVVIPTGGGKSLVIANIVKELDDDVIVFQPSKELLEQNFEKFMAYGGQASIFSASKGSKQISKVTFATIGSVIKRPESFKRFKHVIVDECHLVSPDKGSMYSQFFKVVQCKVVGLTATPIRLKRYGNPDPCSKLVMLDRMRPKVFSEYLHITQISELVERGYFAKTKYLTFDFDKSMLRINTNGSDYTEESLKRAFEQQGVLDQIINCYRSAIANGKKHVLVFLPSIEAAKSFSNKVRSSAYVTGKTPKIEREEILNRFKSGEIKVVANVGVLTTGFDFPKLDCIIGGRPTMSLALYYQMIGRAVRPHAEKKESLIVDIAGNFEKFGRVEDLVIKEDYAGGMGIYAGKKLVTGVEMELIHTDEMDSDDTPVMTFGKHKGKPLNKVPQGYLEWAKENIDKNKRTAYLHNYIDMHLKPVGSVSR